MRTESFSSTSKRSHPGVRSFEILIELSLLLVLFTGIFSSSTIPIEELLLVSVTLVAFIVIFVVGHRTVVYSPIESLCVFFLFIMAFHVQGSPEIQFKLFTNSTLRFPVSTIFLLIATLFYIGKIWLGKGISRARFEFTTPFLAAAAFLLLFALVLYIPLRTVYSFNISTLAHIIRPLILYSIILVIISDYTLTHSQTKRMAVYIVAIFIVILIKGFLMKYNLL
jgi:hypothetical protein